MGFSRDLPLSAKKIAECRRIASSIGKTVSQLVSEYSSVGVERAVLRLLGFDGATQQEQLLYPSSNLILDQLAKTDRLAEGALYWVANAKLHLKKNLSELQDGLLAREIDFGNLPSEPREKVKKEALRLAETAFRIFTTTLSRRQQIKKKLSDPLKEKRPLRYVIVATGNIFEDVTQARAAVLDGADVIAVIRSTAQSLLDYIPQGNTTVGFGGTYATQANFRVMREALDKVGKECRRYVRLTNYASGLCMAEIATLGALEGLDCLLNDAMYGILFRDINIRRTLIDQHFSRMISARAGIWIMTGEDNYLKTTDASKSGDSVLASQFINERTALNANMKHEQMALGHAMEMNYSYDKVIMMELARAKMTRQIFPNCPLKYMCNTKYKSGDIFTSHALDTVFNLIGTFTNQGVLLLGMPTEAIHTPFLQDRSLSIRCANYIVNGAHGMGLELGYDTEGFISKYAQRVLDDTLKLLKKIEKVGLFTAIANGYFADVKRSLDRGKGKEGVFEIDPKRYLNPFNMLLSGKRVS